MKRDLLCGHAFRYLALLVFATVLWIPLSAQFLDEKRYFENLRHDIAVLAHDSLEGREAGTLGDSLAARYIADRFTSISVAPYFSEGYFHPFSFSDRYYFPESTNTMALLFPSPIRWRQEAVTLTSASFTPFIWGNDGNVTGTVVNAGFGLPGYPFPVDMSPGGEGKRSKSTAAAEDSGIRDNIMLARFDVPTGYAGTSGNTDALMREKAQFAKDQGAVALILYDPQGTYLPPSSQLMEGSQVYLPVIFLHDHQMARRLAGAKVTLSLKAQQKQSHTRNVVAHIDNGAEKTVVIGAHYDHLGWGGFNSRDTATVPAIHYGADDNASGVAGMLAIADWLSSQKRLTSRNYIFIAFGAEEKGLIGARRFAEREEINSERVFAMLNLDMIGRLDTLNPQLKLLAAGSSPLWNDLAETPQRTINVTPVKGGVNGSDHYHFYDQGIPVLFLHTGIHEDYHRPSDTPDKINFKGLSDVVEYTIGLLHILDTLSVLPYEKVEADENGRHRQKRQYSLGIVPGHGMDITGLYVQEVSRGWMAEAVGLRKGDVIIRVGDTEVKSIYDYMHALGKISEGDKIEVVVLRNGEPKTFHFQF
jgi:aminopeptidase YwaD